MFLHDGGLVVEARRVEPDVEAIAGAELEEVDHQDGQEHDARDRQIRLAGADGVVDREVPRLLERLDDKQESGKQGVPLHDVSRKADSCWVESDVDVAVAIEVVRLHVDVQESGQDDAPPSANPGTCE